ncbi:MAG: metallophosphoesterase, partial [Lachnospiraceae bacterium]|nr:metallophosphoesterase [Lachnospiraceae bacterium]
MKKVKGLCLAAAGYLLWQKWELEKFNITTYRSKSPKIKGHLKIAVVADLHAHEYGNKNDSLFQRIKAEKPDLILVPGDMIISKYTETFPVAYHAFEELVKIAPVYFSYGNHESRV